jgi:ribosomal protein L40E
MAVPATTAEWICTRCGATNRKLVAVSLRRIADRCVTCHSEHVVERDPRPVRWNARLDE